MGLLVEILTTLGAAFLTTAEKLVLSFPSRSRGVSLTTTGTVVVAAVFFAIGQSNARLDAPTRSPAPTSPKSQGVTRFPNNLFIFFFSLKFSVSILAKNPFGFLLYPAQNLPHALCPNLTGTLQIRNACGKSRFAAREVLGGVYSSGFEPLPSLGTGSRRAA